MSNWRSKKSCCKRNVHYHEYRYPSSRDWSYQVSDEEWNFNPTFNSFNPAQRFDENIDFVKFEKALTSPHENSMTEYFSKTASSKSKSTREISDALNTQTTYLQPPVKFRQVHNNSADEISFKKGCCADHNYIQHRNSTTPENYLPDLSKDLKAMDYLSSISISSDRQKKEADFIYSDVLDSDMLASPFDDSLNGVRNYLLDGTNYLDSHEEEYIESEISPKEKELHENNNYWSEIKVTEVDMTKDKLMNGNTTLLDDLIKGEGMEPSKNTARRETNSTSVETIIKRSNNKHDASVQTQNENMQNNSDAQVQCNIYDNSLINYAESFIQMIKNFSECDLLHKTLETVINSYSADEIYEYKSNCKTVSPKCQSKQSRNQESENTNFITNSKRCNAVSKREYFCTENAVSPKDLVSDQVKEIESLSKVNEKLSEDSKRVVLKENFKLSDEQNTETSRKNIDKECTCNDLKCLNSSSVEEQGITHNKKNYTQNIINSTHNVPNSFKRKFDLKDEEYHAANSKKMCTRYLTKTSDQNSKSADIFNVNSSRNLTEKTIFGKKSFAKQTASVNISRIYEKSIQVASLLDNTKGFKEEVAEVSRRVHRAHKSKKFKSSKDDTQETTGNKIKTSYENIQNVEKSTCDAIINVHQNKNSLEIPLPGQTEKAKSIPKVNEKAPNGRTCKILLANLQMYHRKNTHTLRIIADKLQESKSLRSAKLEESDISENIHIPTLHATKAPDKGIKGSEKFADSLKNGEPENKAFSDFSEQTEEMPKRDAKSLDTRHGVSMGRKRLSQEADTNATGIFRNERILKQEITNKNLKNLRDERQDTSGKEKTSNRYNTVTPNKSIVNGDENVNSNKRRRSLRIKKKSQHIL